MVSERRVVTLSDKESGPALPEGHEVTHDVISSVFVEFPDYPLASACFLIQSAARTIVERQSIHVCLRTKGHTCWR